MFGFDEDQNPLGPDQIFEDISQVGFHGRDTARCPGTRDLATVWSSAWAELRGTLIWRCTMRQDHANRTVTIETHPHKSVAYASIHPCKHADTMKKVGCHQSSSHGCALHLELKAAAAGGRADRSLTS